MTLRELFFFTELFFLFAISIATFLFIYLVKSTFKHNIIIFCSVYILCTADWWQITIYYQFKDNTRTIYTPLGIILLLWTRNKQLRKIVSSENVFIVLTNLLLNPVNLLKKSCSQILKILDQNHQRHLMWRKCRDLFYKKNTFQGNEKVTSVRNVCNFPLFELFWAKYTRPKRVTNFHNETIFIIFILAQVKLRHWTELCLSNFPEAF